MQCGPAQTATLCGEAGHTMQSAPQNSSTNCSHQSSYLLLHGVLGSNRETKTLLMLLLGNCCLQHAMILLHQPTKKQRSILHYHAMSAVKGSQTHCTVSQQAHQSRSLATHIFPSHKCEAFGAGNVAHNMHAGCHEPLLFRARHNVDHLAKQPGWAIFAVKLLQLAYAWQQPSK